MTGSRSARSASGDIPYRINALAAFTSYSIGHNVGASVFTGGAVRYRIYSAWGLNAIDVAKICFLAGLTFWLGNAAVLGLGIAYHPEAASAIDQLPPWLNRVAGTRSLSFALVGYVVWVWIRPRGVGRGPWTVNLPGGPLTLLQIAIGIVDLGFCALAMYVLVPDEPNLGFVVVAVIFRGGDAIGLRQPFARRSWRVRRRHAGRPVADGPGRSVGRHAVIPPALLYRAICHICNLADVSRGYPRMPETSGCARVTPMGSDVEPRREAALCAQTWRHGRLRTPPQCMIRERKESRPDGDSKIPSSTTFYCAVAGPVAALGDHPAGRRRFRLGDPGDARSELSAAARIDGVCSAFAAAALGAVATARSRWPRARTCAASIRWKTCRRQRRGRRHAGSRGAARPGRPRASISMHGRRAVGAGPAQGRARSIRTAFTRDHHCASARLSPPRRCAARPIWITSRLIAGWN